MYYDTNNDLITANNLAHGTKKSFTITLRARIVPAMGKQHVPTAAEIRERIRLRDTGIVLESMETLRLRQKAKDLEREVAQLKDTPKPLAPQDLRDGLDKIFAKFGVEPAEEVIKILQATQLVDGIERPMLSASERAKIWLELLQYRAPKLRSIEHSGKIQQDLQVVIMRFSDGKEIETKKVPLDSDVIDVTVTKSSEMSS